MEKVNVLNKFFATIFPGNLAFHISHNSELLGGVLGSKIPPTVN